MATSSRKKFVWTTQVTSEFLSIARRYQLAKIDAQEKHRLFFIVLERGMQQKGHQVDRSEIKAKWKVLKEQYRLQKIRQPNARAFWMFYDKMDKLVTGTPTLGISPAELKTLTQHQQHVPRSGSSGRIEMPIPNVGELLSKLHKQISTDLEELQNAPRQGSPIVSTPIQLKPSIRLNDNKFQQQLSILPTISEFPSPVTPHTPPQQTQIKLSSAQLQQFLRNGSKTPIRLPVTLANGKSGVGQIQLIPPGSQATRSPGQQVMQTRVGGVLKKFLFTLLTENTTDPVTEKGDKTASVEGHPQFNGSTTENHGYKTVPTEQPQADGNISSLHISDVQHAGPSCSGSTTVNHGDKTVPTEQPQGQADGNISLLRISDVQHAGPSCSGLTTEKGDDAASTQQPQVDVPTVEMEDETASIEPAQVEGSTIEDEDQTTSTMPAQVNVILDGFPDPEESDDDLSESFLSADEEEPPTKKRKRNRKGVTNTDRIIEAMVTEGQKDRAILRQFMKEFASSAKSLTDAIQQIAASAEDDGSDLEE